MVVEDGTPGLGLRSRVSMTEGDGDTETYGLRREEKREGGSRREEEKTGGLRLSSRDRFLAVFFLLVLNSLRTGRGEGRREKEQEWTRPIFR